MASLCSYIAVRNLGELRETNGSAEVTERFARSPLHVQEMERTPGEPLNDAMEVVSCCASLPSHMSRVYSITM